MYAYCCTCSHTESARKRRSRSKGRIISLEMEKEGQMKTKGYFACFANANIFTMNRANYYFSRYFLKYSSHMTVFNIERTDLRLMQSRHFG